MLTTEIKYLKIYILANCQSNIFIKMNEIKSIQTYFNKTKTTKNDKNTTKLLKL